MGHRSGFLRLLKRQQPISLLLSTKCKRGLVGCLYSTYGPHEFFNRGHTRSARFFARARNTERPIAITSSAGINADKVPFIIHFAVHSINCVGVWVFGSVSVSLVHFINGVNVSCRVEDPLSCGCCCCCAAWVQTIGLLVGAPVFLDVYAFTAYEVGIYLIFELLRQLEEARG